MSQDALPVGKLRGDLLAQLIGRHRIDDPAVVVGPGVGRDAAAIQIGDQTLVVKTDPITFATDEAPLYLVNVTANDLACLGATPRWMLVTALLPAGQTTAAMVETLFRDLQQACDERGIALIGGHTEVTAGLDRVLLVGQLLGIADRGHLIRPGQARPGDRLLLTNALAIEGTALLARELRTELTAALGEETVARAARLLTDPGISVVRHASLLAEAQGVTALHDPTEGGLATGVRELAHASECGAVVDLSLVPILPETRAVADVYGLDPLGMLASGSLLAAIDPAAVAKIDAVCAAQQIPHAWIGKLISPQRGLVLIRHGRPAKLPSFDSDEVARPLSAKH